LSPGPYGFIFASFVPFFFDIPVSTRFKVLGARFSDKSFVYLAGLQVKSYQDRVYLMAGLFVQSSNIQCYLRLVKQYRSPSVCAFLLFLTLWFVLPASVVIVEAVSYSWNLWTSSWVPLQIQYFGNKKSEGSAPLLLAFL
jgi:hypothetical protein